MVIIFDPNPTLQYICNKGVKFDHNKYTFCYRTWGTNFGVCSASEMARGETESFVQFQSYFRTNTHSLLRPLNKEANATFSAVLNSDQNSFEKPLIFCGYLHIYLQLKEISEAELFTDPFLMSLWSKYQHIHRVLQIASYLKYVFTNSN